MADADVSGHRGHRGDDRLVQDEAGVRSGGARGSGQRIAGHAAVPAGERLRRRVCGHAGVPGDADEDSAKRDAGAADHQVAGFGALSGIRRNVQRPGLQAGWRRSQASGDPGSFSGKPRRQAGSQQPPDRGALRSPGSAAGGTGGERACAELHRAEFPEQVRRHDASIELAFRRAGGTSDQGAEIGRRASGLRAGQPDLADRRKAGHHDPEARRPEQIRHRCADIAGGKGSAVPHGRVRQMWTPCPPRKQTW